MLGTLMRSTRLARMTMPKIVFLNRYFYPDHSATSQMVSDLAFYLAGKGRHVHVIAGVGANDGAKADLADERSIHDVAVHRVLASRGKVRAPI